MNVRPDTCIRSFLAAVVGTAALLSTAVEAQSYPSKPIEFIVHTSPEQAELKELAKGCITKLHSITISALRRHNGSCSIRNVRVA